MRGMRPCCGRRGGGLACVYRIDDDNDPREETIVFFCADCFAREFAPDADY